MIDGAATSSSSAAALEKSCFVIAPIGEAGSDIRKRSDQVLRHIIEPAIKSSGYKALRADQIAEPGMITSQILQHIVDDPLVIADLTDRNPNVYYELAVRHAIRKPLVQIIAKGEALPFDVAGTRTVHFDYKDLDSVDEARKEIEKQIKFLEKSPQDIETPISVSLDLQYLRQSENPEERSLGDLLASMSELKLTLVGIEKRINDPGSLLPPAYLRDIGVLNPREKRRLSRHGLDELLFITERLGAASTTGPEGLEEAKRWAERLKYVVEKLADVN